MKVDQIGKCYPERVKQISGSFLLKNSKQIKDQSVTPMDDVLMNSATLEVAARLLCVSGAKQVYGAVIAWYLLQ